jgi:hypothetical protein
MSEERCQKPLRELLAINGDLRRRVQRAAILAAFDVIRDSGYSITPQDIEEMKSDQTALAIALGEISGVTTRGDNLPEVIVAAGVGAAIAAGGF